LKAKPISPSARWSFATTHTGYGYIGADAPTLIAAPVTAFVEKPDKAKAVSLLETNRFFWNAGIFLFRADVFLAELRKFAPEIVNACQRAIDLGKEDADFLRPDAEAFKTCPSNSIDYAVMEKTANAAVVPLDAGWSDVGSWAALHDVSAKDDKGNALFGDVIAHDCANSYIASNSRLVTAVGLKDVIVVEDKDSVLVAHKDRSQDVKELVDELNR
jgi:mannose-1-phosphate guanylyltransferase/mannose-6-phosphate isomerase